MWRQTMIKHCIWSYMTIHSIAMNIHSWTSHYFKVRPAKRSLVAMDVTLAAMTLIKNQHWETIESPSPSWGRPTYTYIKIPVICMKFKAKIKNKNSNNNNKNNKKNRQHCRGWKKGINPSLEYLHGPPRSLKHSCPIVEHVICSRKVRFESQNSHVH